MVVSLFRSEVMDDFSQASSRASSVSSRHREAGGPMGTRDEEASIGVKDA